MTEPEKKKKFLDEEEFPELYSLNFLMAQFTPVSEMNRNQKILQNQLLSSRYGSHNLSVDMYYKHISTLGFSLEYDDTVEE